MTKVRSLLSLKPQSDAVWAVIARVNGVLASLAFIFLYTNEVGKTEAGSLLLWLSVVNIAAALGSLGRPQFVYTEPAAAFHHADYGSVLNFVWSSVVWISVCTASFAGLGFLLILNSIDHVPALLIAFLAISTALLIFLTEVLRVLQRFVLAAIANSGTSYVVLCMFTIFAERDWIDPKSIIVYLLLVHYSLIALALAAIWRALVTRTNSDGKLWMQHNIGWPISNKLWSYWLNAIPVVVLYQFDVLIVALFFGPTMVTEYTLASRLAAGLSFINSLAYSILPVRISSFLINGNMTQIGQELRKFSKRLSGLAVIAILLLLNLIHFDYIEIDGKYSLMGFGILAVAHGINCFFGARSVVLQLAGYAKSQALISWIFALICGCLLWLAAAMGNFIFVFFVVAASIVGQALAESWILFRLLGISSVPGIPDRVQT